MGETGNRFATVTAINAAPTPAPAPVIPVQAQVHYVDNLNNNNNNNNNDNINSNNKLGTYETVDETKMHRMDHGR